MDRGFQLRQAQCFILAESTAHTSVEGDTAAPIQTYFGFACHWIRAFEEWIAFDPPTDWGMIEAIIEIASFDKWPVPVIDAQRNLEL